MTGQWAGWIQTETALFAKGEISSKRCKNSNLAYDMRLWTSLSLSEIITVVARLRTEVQYLEKNLAICARACKCNILKTGVFWRNISQWTNIIWATVKQMLRREICQTELVFWGRQPVWPGSLNSPYTSCQTKQFLNHRSQTSTGLGYFY